MTDLFDELGQKEKSKQKIGGDLFDELEGSEPVQVEVINQPKPQTLMGKAADLFTGESRMTKEIEKMPEIGSAPELNEFSMAALKSSLGSLMSGDPTDIKGILSKNYPEAQFREDAKGNIIADLPSGAYVLNRPGMTPADLIRGVFDIAAFTPVGRAAVSAPTLAAKVGIGALGSGAVEAGRQVGVEALGGEGL